MPVGWQDTAPVWMLMFLRQFYYRNGSAIAHPLRCAALAVSVLAVPGATGSVTGTSLFGQIRAPERIRLLCLNPGTKLIRGNIRPYTDPTEAFMHLFLM